MVLEFLEAILTTIGIIIVCLFALIFSLALGIPILIAIGVVEFIKWVFNSIFDTIDWIFGENEKV